MFKDSFLFELRYRLKSAGTWICFIGLLLMSYREMLAGEWDLLIQSGRIARNSPYTVYYLFMYYTFWTATVGSALMIPTLLRDLKSGTAELLYSFPLHSKYYFLGKYCASMLILTLVMSSVVVGFITMPFITTALGTHSTADFIATPWAHIGHSFLLWVLPSCFVYGTLTFILTSLTGRAAPVYSLMMLSVGLFVTITAVYGDGAPKSNLVQVLDPLGKVTVEGQIYYWTAEERMNKFLAFEGSLMQNRLLYIGIAALALLFALVKFDAIKLLQQAKNRGVASFAKRLFQIESIDNTSQKKVLSTTINKSDFTSSKGSWITYALSAGWKLFRVVLSNKAFYLSMLTLILMLVLAGFSYQPVGFEGSGKILPKAIILLPSLMYPSLIFTLVAMAFFSIEMCDREKLYRLDQLVESCSVPTWSIMLSKLVGVSLMAFILALVPISAMLIIQYGQGFFDTNWAVLASVTLLVLFPLMLAYGLISIICYAVLSNKALAQSVAVIICITPAIFNEVKTVENFMYLWAWPFFVQLSDFNASGQYLQRSISFSTYWLSFYSLLLVVAYWFWPRGTNLTFKIKCREAYYRLHPINILLVCTFSGIFVWSVTDIHNGMVVRNNFQTSDMKYAEQADYEHRYGATINDIQPKIIAADLKVDLYPSERRANYSATLTIKNKAAEVVNELVIHYAKFSNISQLTYNQEILKAVEHDLEHRRLRYLLPSPLVQEEKALLEMVLAVDYHGFSNDEFDYHGTIVADGSYFSSELWPSFGYDNTRELESVGFRKKHDLPVKNITSPLSKVAGISDFVNTDDADFVTVRTTISTEHDQFVIASGKLIEEKRQADRVTYVYQNSEPTLWEPNIVSAGYQLVRETWQSKEGGKVVPIEIYHHPEHQYNVSRILVAARQALSQGYSQWGEFPYQSLRIAEVPNGMTETKVNGNLLIIPENNVWLHDYRQFPEIDWITFQIARDVSRVWWQQLAIADVRGHKLLTEAVPIMQGLKAIENKWGKLAQVKFVDLLSDMYLRQRTSEDQLEAAVIDLTNEDYASTKAALALYSSYQLLGASKFDKALSQLLNHHRGDKSAPYTHIGEVFKQLVDATVTIRSRKALSQLFNDTNYFDFQVVSAKASTVSDQVYQLQANLLATKFIYQSGIDEEVKYKGYAKVKILGGELGADILFEKQVMFEQGQALLNLNLSKNPTRVIVNPYREFIERSPSNNVFSF